MVMVAKLRLRELMMDENLTRETAMVSSLACKRDEPNAATSAIPLEQLNDKKFGQRDLEIEPPPAMSYKRDDPNLESALFEGHLPGETEDFFTEHKIKQYF